MDVLVVGYGVIGTMYGYAFQKAGHMVEHLIRGESVRTTPSKVSVSVLDGRIAKKGRWITDVYELRPRTDRTRYDFIFMSVSSGKVRGVVEELNRQQIIGTLLYFCGTWDDAGTIRELMRGRPYLLGYPVAGGNKTSGGIEGALFPHVMVEREENAQVPNYHDLIQMLASSQLVTESPPDMLEWIWIHMAVNAAVISVASEFGDFTRPAEAAAQFMKSRRGLSRAVRGIRETLKIVEARGVDLSKYKNEVGPYRIPTLISSLIMLRMFRTNALTRKIMELHNNREDLVFVCRTVYDEGKRHHIDAPVFYGNFERFSGAVYANVD